MKKLISIILSILFILPSLTFLVFAEDVEIISGGVLLKCEDADDLVFGDKDFTPMEDLEFTVNVTVSDSTSTYNTVFLNGKKLGALKDGSNDYVIKASNLLEGDNEITVKLGTGKKTYDDAVVYGTVNLDDIAVESVSFSGVEFTSPKSMKKYMPIAGAAGTNPVEVNYAGSVAIGDGWFADTGLGGNTLDKPVYTGYVFTNPLSGGSFFVDTTTFADGEYLAEYFNENGCLDSKKYFVDNTAPAVEFSIKNGTSISKFDTVDFTVSDISSHEFTLTVDGKKAEKIDVNKLSVGSHTAFITAKDAAGNVTNKVLVFNITDKRYSVSIDGGNISVSTIGDAKVYSGETLKQVYMLENPIGKYGYDTLDNANESLVSFNNKTDIVTTAIGNSVPYQSFVVNTEGAKGETVVVSYNGETGNGVGIVLKAWNYVDSCWDVIAKTTKGGYISVEVEFAKYSKDNKMKVNAEPNIVYNGSETLLWNSDTQYYSRYGALNVLYYDISKYAVDLYNKGDLGYCVHTGDLIDQAHVSEDVARNEYSVADRAQAILDKANVPNGVVVGNHDIKHNTADYSYYYDYFGEERYNKFDWYGGSLNNNMHHYDLVSLGAYDFVFMYLGTYKEAEEDTIAWANAVCEAYPNRNVIICTHEYLLPSGAFSGDRAEVIWDKIVVPNENVVMVLCGHNDGVCDQVRQVGDSDRYVVEILADYQFADLGKGGNGITYIENNCTLDGEGFIRLMSFNDAGQMISTTYSPSADMYNYYPSYSDSFVYDMNLVPAQRSIRTLDFNVVANVTSEGNVGDSGMDLSGKDAFFVKMADGTLSEAFVLNAYESNYYVPERKQYEVPVPEKVGTSGYENVSENFHMNEKNDLSKLNVEMGFDLLKLGSGKLTRTSGSTNYTSKIGENHSITISHKAGNGGENWVTLANYFKNTKVDVTKYNRLYFGVTAGKSAKWNIYVNFAGNEINFSQNTTISQKFGYVNSVPSDIVGTWNGYIDLSELNIKGEKNINSIYIVTATPGETITFDYLFLGHSDEGKVRFITSDTIISAVEAPVGEKVDLLAAPFKNGYVFDGWYTAKDGGEKVTEAVTVTEDVINLYARFIEKDKYVSETDETSNNSEVVPSDNNDKEQKNPIKTRLIFIIGSAVFVLLGVCILLIKAYKTKK